MENFEILYDGIDVQKYMLTSINKAKKNIYLSAWNIDLTFLIDAQNKLTLFDVLTKRCKLGVKVYLITSVAPGTICKSNNKNILRKNKIHSNFNIKILDMEKSNIFSPVFDFFNKLNPIFSNKLCCNRLFHQRYFLVDDKYCLICSTDSNKDKYCSLCKKVKNSKEYIWIEYSVIIKPNKEIIDYCKNNFNQSGKALLTSNIFYGNFYTENTEYNKIVELITNSKKFIFIENQWLQSHSGTYNQILKLIGDKILKEKQLGNNFKVIIIIEKNYIDDCNKETKKHTFSLDNIFCIVYSTYFQYLLLKSLYFLKSYLMEKDKTLDINKYLHVYSGTSEIFIHSKNWIFDNKYMLIGSSNIWDRSYTPGQDIELSILLKGPKIKKVNDTIITQYNENFKNSSKRNDVNNMIYYLDKSKVLEKINIYQIQNPISICFRTFIITLFIIMVLFFIIKNYKTIEL